MAWNKKWEYAMYKGDQILAIGTKEEICKQMNIKEQTFSYYRTKKYKERLSKRKNNRLKGYRTIIRIDED